MLTDKFQEHSKRIMHYDQSEIIPDMQEWFNLMQANKYIHHINK